MRYENFTIQLLSDTESRILVRASSPQGECTAEAELPPDLLSSARLVDLSGTGSRDLRPASGDRPPEGLREVGRRLFQSFFHSEVHTLWQRSWGEQLGREDRGLRIRLQLDLGRPGALRLAGLPWELLHDDSCGGFLTLDGRTPVVRYLEVATKARRFPNVRPWRVLVVAPQPANARPLDLAAELARLRDVSGEGDRIQVEETKRATVGGLRDELVRRRFQAVHFMGHGLYDENTGVGGLLLEPEDGHSGRLLGGQLARLLAGVELPSLFVLNGCRTGQIGAGPGAEAFAGAATALVRAGVPAVVAMQRPITDPDAIRFSYHLFAALAAGQPVDWAVCEARLRLHLHDHDSRAWAIPSLFSRVADGRIFAPAEPTAAAPRPASPGPVVRAGTYKGKTLIIEQTGGASSREGSQRTALSAKEMEVDDATIIDRAPDGEE